MSLMHQVLTGITLFDSDYATCPILLYEIMIVRSDTIKALKCMSDRVRYLYVCNADMNK